MFDVLRKRLSQFSERIAIVSNNKEYSYGDLTAEVEKQELYFEDNCIGSKHVVVIIGEFSLIAIASLIALTLRKSTVIPLTKEAYFKLGEYVDKLQVDFVYDTYENELIHKEDSESACPQWKSILPRQAGGLVVFTSGSTGVPKAIVHDMDSLCYRYLELKPPISAICFLLFDHMGGINTILFLLFRGGTAINIESRKVDLVCKAIEEYNVELLPTTPSFLSQMLIENAHNKYDLSSLNIISYGTEVMNEVVLKQLNSVLPGCVFKQTYGLSETGVFQIKSQSNDSLWFQITDDGVETKIVEEILWIKTKSNLLGKVLFVDGGALLEKASDDWFCTNDIVEEKDKYIRILGRETDIINVGGLKVYPSEVENCIQELDYVADVFVKAKKHVLLGQIVVAYILLNEGVEKHEIKKLLRPYCLSKLERYKVPSQFLFKWENFVNDRFKKVRV